MIPELIHTGNNLFKGSAGLRQLLNLKSNQALAAAGRIRAEYVDLLLCTVLFFIERLPKNRAVVTAAQMLTQSNDEHHVCLPLESLHICLRGWTCGTRALRTLSHQADILLLIEGLVINKAVTPYLKRQRDNLKMRILSVLIRKVAATVCNDLVHHVFLLSKTN